MAYEVLSRNLEFLSENAFNHTYNSYYNFKTKSAKNYRQYYDHSIDQIDAYFVNRIVVKSSSVKWIDYIADMEILVVKFKNSRVYYMYFDVPEAVYQKFKLSESPGRFVHQYLAGYKYDSFDKYADWLNVYQSVREITNSIE